MTVVRLRPTPADYAYLLDAGVRGGIWVPPPYRLARPPQRDDGNWYLGRAVVAAGVPVWVYFSHAHTLAVVRLGVTFGDD